VLGDTAVTGSADTTLKVWDLKRIPRDPDGGFPAFEDEDEAPRVECERTLTGHDATVFCSGLT